MKGDSALDDYMEYLTVEGDTFDIVALDMYDDEFKSHLIMQANPKYIHYIQLPAGVTLKIPIIEDEPADTLPPWKR